MIKPAHTLFDAEALGAYAAGAYRLGSPETCRLWRSFINDVYRLDAGGRTWWLRVHPVGWRSTPQTQSELNAVLLIAEAGASVARPVPLEEGGYILSLEAPEGRRDAVLFAHAPGLILRYFEPNGVSNARKYGAAAARLHNLADSIAAPLDRPQLDLNTTLLQPAANVARHLDLGDQNDLARIVSRLQDELRSRPDLTLGFCHGDLNSANIHFDDDHATVFDFDCCAWGWRAFELAAFARGVSWSRQPSEEVQALINAYFEGYESQRPLPACDLEVQPQMLLIQRLWVTSLHLDRAPQWGSAAFGRPYAASFVQWLRSWDARP